MIRAKLSPQSELLRAELKTWLAANPPPQAASDSSLDTFVTIGRAWQKKLALAKWIGVYWPAEYGGRDLTLMEEALVQEELVRAGAPQILGLFGITMVGPVLIKHGSPEQKSRFLSKILSADEIWCQGFSEPNAGSDLAAVKTKAIPVENGFRVTGQKIWTSFAHVADWCFLLARTGEGKKKHEGLMYLLVDMKTPGITVRPLTQITGDNEFNEVFFEDVFIPKENIVGNVGDGWKIALSTLMYERVVLTFARQIQSENLLNQLLAQRDSLTEKHREELASCVAEACAVRALAYQHLVHYSKGHAPGPEGSMDKLLWSESFQKLTKLSYAIAGESVLFGESGTEHGADVHRYLYSRGRTIAAGTSEIQRNIIAERVLGLPRLTVSR